MGQVLHGSATTTEAVRRAIRHCRASLRGLSKRHGTNRKTVATWKKRTSVVDQRRGPKDPRSKVLSPEDEGGVAFRRRALLPLDDCLDALEATIPYLTRSSPHRCLQRHGISRLPEIDGDMTERSRFKAYLLGDFPSIWPRSTRRKTGSTVRRHRPHDRLRLRDHLADFVSARDFARRLKTLRGLTPYEAICKVWSADPGRFQSNPPKMPQPNNWTAKQR